MVEYIQREDSKIVIALTVDTLIRVYKRGKLNEKGKDL